MTLEEYLWCLAKNHWDDELEHIPMGWPEPALLEPVWWWQGYHTRWAPTGITNKVNEFRSGLTARRGCCPHGSTRRSPGAPVLLVLRAPCAMVP